ncbi:SOS response-associated peptidase [Acinetobacter sp. YH16032]|uniref:SOS response-associated peptidase n=1 Tax=Acinetobacter sp. YH16032 TaxID=2601181 RepID=UPI0015D32012|nr:SOS response-associated peptidase family protein [Acinetobacter sp. YH16032]
MCSNYEFPSKNKLHLLDLYESQLELDFRQHVFPLYDAPIIMNGAEQFDLDVAKFGLVPHWSKDLKFGRHTYNARTETIAEKPSFRSAWKNDKFCLIPVQEFYEPKYIDGKPHWCGISREDKAPFTVAGIYEDAIIDGRKIRSFSMLTINAEHHPFMKQFHGPDDEKRSIIVIPEKYRKDWLTVSHLDAHELFFEMDDEYITKPFDRSSENKQQDSLF